MLQTALLTKNITRIITGNPEVQQIDMTAAFCFRLKRLSLIYAPAYFISIQDNNICLKIN